jgi:hypothetical protein
LIRALRRAVSPLSKTPVMVLDWTLRDLINFFVDMIYPMSFFILLLLLIPVLFIPKPWAYSVQKIMIPITFLIEASLLLTMRLYIDAHTIVFLVVSGLGLKALYSDDVWRYYMKIREGAKCCIEENEP